MNVIPDSSFFICFLDDLEGHLPISDRVRILMSLGISHGAINEVPVLQSLIG